MKNIQSKIALFCFLQICITLATSKSFRPATTKSPKIQTRNSFQDQRILSGEFADPIEMEFAKVLVQQNFHGEWHFVNTTNPSNAKFRFFENQGGMLKISTTITPDEYLLDLLMVDGSNSDQKFIILSFHRNIFVKTLNKETSTFQLKDYPITYRRGENFFMYTGFADRLKPITKCTLNRFAFSFWNSDTNQPFKALVDENSDLRIRVDIQSDDCGFSVEGSLVQNYGRKFNLQIWLYISLVCFCILSQLIVLIIQSSNSRPELSLPHRFQLSFILTLNIQFMKMNLMFFGQYLYDFSRAWVFLVVALAFFLIFLLEIRILIQFEDQSFESYSWGPFAGLGLFICFLMFSSDYYWILYPYVMTPIMDILQSYTCSRRWSYSYSFYFGYLMPYLPLIGYFKWYQDNFARFSPAPPVFHWCSFFIFFGLTWLVARTVMKRLSPDPEEPRFKVIESYEGEVEECAICLEQLQTQNAKINCQEKAKKVVDAEEVCVLQQEVVGENNKKVGCERVLETPCGHFFHKRCVEKWLDIKAVCPLCSRQIPDSIAN